MFTGILCSLLATLLVLGLQTGTPPPSLVFLGHPDHLEFVRPLARGLPARYNQAPTARDAVVFVVSATDGPMARTRDQIEAIKGKPRGPAAILLVEIKGQSDPEINQLVIRETRELLKASGQTGYRSMPVFQDDDPNLIYLLRGLLASPP